MLIYLSCAEEKNLKSHSCFSVMTNQFHFPLYYSSYIFQNDQVLFYVKDRFYVKML